MPAAENRFRIPNLHPKIHRRTKKKKKMDIYQNFTDRLKYATKKLEIIQFKVNVRNTQVLYNLIPMTNASNIEFDV